MQVASSTVCSGPELGTESRTSFTERGNRERVEDVQRHARREVPLAVDVDADLVLVREADEDILGPHEHRIGGRSGPAWLRR